MSSNDQAAFSTPQTDAAERFFYEAGRPPVGFVGSGLARVLEVELGRALAQLKTHGLEAPPPLDARAQAQLQSPRRPRSVAPRAPTPGPGAGGLANDPSPVPQLKLLPATCATEALGEPRGYDDGEVLYRRGERAEHLFIVLQGQVRVAQSSDGGADRIAGAGQVLGEHGMFEEGVHTESVQASGQARCALIPSAQLRALLGPDAGLLGPVMMSLVLQYRMARTIAAALATGTATPRYSVLGEKTYTGPELHRALVEARTQEPGQGLSSAQLHCLTLQACELMPTRLLRAGASLGRPGGEHLGLGLMTVSGLAQASIGDHALELGQGCVIGVAEGLTGSDFSWSFQALQDINARAFPLDRALQRLERADPLMRALASHLCAVILAQQAAALG